MCRLEIICSARKGATSTVEFARHGGCLSLRTPLVVKHPSRATRGCRRHHALTSKYAHEVSQALRRWEYSCFIFHGTLVEHLMVPHVQGKIRSRAPFLVSSGARSDTAQRRTFIVHDHCVKTLRSPAHPSAPIRFILSFHPPRGRRSNGCIDRTRWCGGGRWLV